jgi:hypothetical protein
MRVGVRGSLVQWVDEKPWRFKLILLLHTAAVGRHPPNICYSRLTWRKQGLINHASRQNDMALVLSHSRLRMWRSACERRRELVYV